MVVKPIGRPADTDSGRLPCKSEAGCLGRGVHSHCPGGRRFAPNRAAAQLAGLRIRVSDSTAITGSTAPRLEQTVGDFRASRRESILGGRPMRPTSEYRRGACDPASSGLDSQRHRSWFLLSRRLGAGDFEFPRWSSPIFRRPPRRRAKRGISVESQPENHTEMGMDQHDHEHWNRDANRRGCQRNFSDLHSNGRRSRRIHLQFVPHRR